MFIVRFIFRWWARCCPLQHWSRLHQLQCYSATFAADDAEFVKICKDVLLDKLRGYTFFLMALKFLFLYYGSGKKYNVCIMEISMQYCIYISISDVCACYWTTSSLSSLEKQSLVIKWVSVFVFNFTLFLLLFVVASYVFIYGVYGKNSAT